MQNEFWLNKWKNSDIKFHLPEVNSILIKYAYFLPKGKILVPLCGKSMDMLWLLSNGYYVIGVELSPLACEAFFNENMIPFEIEDRFPFKIYKGSNIEIWCGDILKLPLDIGLDLVAIYDRAALVALPHEIRKLYVKHILALTKLAKNINILIITVEYDQNIIDGPPFSITEEMLKDLYNDIFIVKQLPLEHINFLKLNPRFDNVKIEDHVYLLTPYLS